MVPIPGARSNPLDRHLLAVLGYLQGERNRLVTIDGILRRWPEWMPKPLPKATRIAVRRLLDRGVLEHRDGAFRVNRELQRAASEKGCRFRYVPADFDGSLARAAAEFLAMIRGRAQGRTTAWGDSAGFLATLLGSDERTVRRSMGEAIEVGRLEVVARRRLRTGHSLPVLRIVATGRTKSPTNELGAVRTPGDAVRSPGCAVRLPDNLVLKQDLASLGSSARPRPLALLTWNPDPPAAGKSRACGADDPIRSRDRDQQMPESAAVPPPPLPRVVPPWAEVEGLEHTTAASVANWDTFEENLRRAVRRLHMATSGVDQLHHALIAAGVFLPWQPMNAAGRAGLRRKRVALAESLAAQHVEPSLVLEVVFMRMRRLGEEGAAPRQVGADLVEILSPKTPEFIERSNARVALGKGPLPMAAGADALTHLVRPGHRLPGEFVYPASWWRDSAPQDVLDRIADLRALPAALVATKQVAEDHGQVAAEQLRLELARRERDRRVQEQDRRQREQEAGIRQAHKRLIGAAQARLWRRVHDRMGPGVTIEQLSEWSGVPLDELRRGLASVVRRDTA